MKKKYKILFILLICTHYIFANPRIVTIGGSVTEIVFALGIGKDVIAVDQSSTIPDLATELPQVGYIRAISAEGVLSTNPTIIITTTDIGPPNAVSQLKNSGIDMEIFDSPKNYKGIINLVKEISKLLDLEKKGQEIVQRITKSHDIIHRRKKNNKKNPNIAFFMDARNSGSLNAAGKDTRANYLIELAGGINIFKDSFQRYQKISNENLLIMNPDIILIATMSKNSTLESDIKNSEVYKELKSVKENKVFSIDLGKNLTFGTHTIDVALELLDVFYDDSNK